MLPAMSLLTYRRAVILVTGAALLVSCGGAENPSSPSNTHSSRSANSSTSASVTPSNGPNPSEDSASLAAAPHRCGPPTNPHARPFTLYGPHHATMPGVDVGSGSTIAVLLHQTDGGALCGFWPFANWLATTHRLRAIAFDLCGYGLAVCTDAHYSSNQIAQVALAVRWARSHGGRRIVLVGASMGGALALGAATMTKADALVDLSGPESWPDAEAAVAAPRITVPALVSTSPGDGTTSYAALRAAFARIAAAPKLFVTGDGAHGWDLLADYTTAPIRWRPLATTVAQWIAGHYH